MPEDRRDRDGNRSRLDDVARTAGVGIATVDRVLNDRGGVSPETARRVLAAARQLGLKRTLLISHHRGLRFEVLLIRPELPLIERMGRAFADIAGTLDRSVVIQRSTLVDDRPAHLAERLRATKANAVVTYAPEDHAIHEAVAALAAAGVPVVSLISDISAASRLAYAGIDHFAAGRTAGYYTARMAPPGPVILLCNHLSYSSHNRRVAGFADALGRHGTGLAVAEVIEGSDQALPSRRLLAAALRRHPTTVAIYNAGAAHEAVEAVLRDGGRRIVFIGHEVTPHTRAMVDAGLMSLIIDQNPERQARYTIEVLLQHFGHEVGGGVANRPEGNTPFTLHGPYNLDL